MSDGSQRKKLRKGSLLPEKDDAFFKMVEEDAIKLRGDPNYKLRVPMAYVIPYMKQMNRIAKKDLGLRKVCPYCGKSFVLDNITNRKIYCSDLCVYSCSRFKAKEQYRRGRLAYLRSKNENMDR